MDRCYRRHRAGLLRSIGWWGNDAQELTLSTSAVFCVRLCAMSTSAGVVEVGDPVLLNTTAQTLKLGTGGYDFVIAA